MSQTIETLCKNDGLFHNRLKILENTTYLFKNSFQWPTITESWINGHDEDLDIMDRAIQNFLTVTNKKFYNAAMTLNNHPLAIKIFTKVYMAYTKVWRKYMEIYDTYNRAFEYFLLVLPVLLNDT